MHLATSEGSGVLVAGESIMHKSIRKQTHMLKLLGLKVSWDQTEWHEFISSNVLSGLMCETKGYYLRDV